MQFCGAFAHQQRPTTTTTTTTDIIVSRYRLLCITTSTIPHIKRGSKIKTQSLPSSCVFTLTRWRSIGFIMVPWKNSTVVKWRLKRPSSSKSGGFLYECCPAQFRNMVRVNLNLILVGVVFYGWSGLTKFDTGVLLLSSKKSRFWNRNSAIHLGYIHSV